MIWTNAGFALTQIVPGFNEPFPCDIFALKENLKNDKWYCCFSYPMILPALHMLKKLILLSWNFLLGDISKPHRTFLEKCAFEVWWPFLFLDFISKKFMCNIPAFTFETLHFTGNAIAHIFWWFFQCCLYMFLICLYMLVYVCIVGQLKKDINCQFILYNCSMCYEFYPHSLDLCMNCIGKIIKW